MNEPLRAELRQLASHDLKVRGGLLANGALGDGYHPQMRTVHEQNAARLESILDEVGWPSHDLVGEDGTEAAWLIAQHAIGRPAFQRRCLALLQDAAKTGKIPAWQPAYLLDRIRMFEGRPQIYGTQFEEDENGEPHPTPIEDPDHVNERRAKIGLDSLEERLQKMRNSEERTRNPNAIDPQERKRKHQEWKKGYEAWLGEVGWRD